MGFALPNANATTLPPILYADQGGFAHQCTILGGDGTTQGVLCIDIVTQSRPTQNGYAAQAQLELVCQQFSLSTLSEVAVQCADAKALWGLFNPSGAIPGGDTFSEECGHHYGACAPDGQRNYWKSTPMTYSNSANGINNCSGNVNLPTQVWAVAFSTNFDTAIELPGSDQWVYLTPSNSNDSPGQSSGHYFICP